MHSTTTSTTDDIIGTTTTNTASVPCFHGGAFFEAIGVGFEDLGRRRAVINADVLDAWYPPAPGVLETLREHLDWLARTSPPTHAEGLVAAIARARGVPEGAVLVGGGSSDLIFLALREWLRRGDVAGLPDPTYGEYAHVLERVIGCRAERMRLYPENDYAVEVGRLAEALARRPRVFVLVNPNSPTGGHVRRAELERVLRAAPRETLVWVDETYVEHAGEEESLERFAVTTPNVVVCKSMSKVYALSGLRVAYLCGAPERLAGLRGLTPPWAVGLPAQVAAVRALEAPEYYARRVAETRVLRAELAEGLRALGCRVAGGVANFVLATLPEAGAPGASELLRRCRERGLFLRELHTFTDGPHERLVRVAVKDAETQARMLEIIGETLRPGRA